MSPTERWESGRSTRSSTRRSSSRMATRVSRGFPEISISRFKAVTLTPRRETAAPGKPVVFPAIVQLARPIWRAHRDDSIGEAAERRQSPMHGGKRKASDRLGQHNGRTKAVEGGRRRENATGGNGMVVPLTRGYPMFENGSVRTICRLEGVSYSCTPHLQSNGRLPQARTVRPYIAGASRRIFGSREHSGGVVTKGKCRVPSLSRHFSWFSLRSWVYPEICAGTRTPHTVAMVGVRRPSATRSFPYVETLRICHEVEDRPRPPSPALARLIDQAAEQLPRNHDALNLARSLADLADLGVPHHALDRVLGGVAVPAMQLHGLGRGAHAQLGRIELGHRRFLLKRVALLLEPGGVVDELFRGLDLGRHVGEREMHALEARDRPAELLAGGRIRQTLVQRSLGQSER